MRRWLGPFATRPRLMSAIAIGLAALLVLLALPFDLNWSTRASIAWDIGCIVFIAAVLASFGGGDPAYIRAHAAAQDEGRGLILTLVLITATASLATVGFELSLAKGDAGLVKAAHVALAFCTVSLSWFVVQLIFALHYAHEYYLDPDEDPATAQQGGLAFPGKQLPDYWDFLHFSVVIGVASQTADIAFTARPMRRIGTVHSLIAFSFNTLILALSINLLAGLF
jgi:uncharacterized membrane protein